MLVLPSHLIRQFLPSDEDYKTLGFILTTKIKFLI